MLQEDEIDAIVAQLDGALRSGTPIRPLGATHPGILLDDAYAIQERWVDLQIARGREPAGYKLGLTSSAAQRALGVDRPIYGVIFADSQVPDGGVAHLQGLIAPRVEPELAFIMAEPLAAGCTAAEALEAIGQAAPAMEIIDNRVMARDPETGLTRNAIDIVADGGGVSGFAICGQRFDPRSVALAGIEAVFTSGTDSETGLFSEVFGSPENALVELACELARRGRAIAAGDIVLTGSPLKPTPLAAGGRVTADFGALGKLEIAVD